MRCALPVLAGALLAAGAAAAPAIVPDAEMQRQIARVAAAENADDLRPPLERLRALGGAQFAALVPQLVYFSMQARDVRQGMAAAVVVRDLGITSAQLLAGITPYLDTDDAALGRELRTFLAAIDGEVDGRPDFAVYEPLLRARCPDPPVILVRHLLEAAPDRGLAVLAETCAPSAAVRSTLLAARGARSPEALGSLADSDLWWARLYVAERLRQDPSLRTPALLYRLQADRHPAVRGALPAAGSPGPTPSAGLP